MRCELPELKRFCFCFPIRYGLIGWVSFNMVLLTYNTYWQIIKIHNLLNNIEDDGNIYRESIFLTLYIVEWIFNIIFLYGAFTKNEKLLKVSLIGNIVLGILATVYFMYLVICVMYLLYGYHLQIGWARVKSIAWKVFVEFMKIGVNILCQWYIQLLVWSNIKKLKRNHRPVMFVNHAAEAKCTMECDKEGDVEENREEDELQTETAEILVEITEGTCDK